MSENTHKAVLPTWVAAVNVILLVAAFVCNLLCLKNADLFGALPILCNIVTVLSGAYYCFAGYKKNGSLFYKMFVWLFAINHFFVTLYLVKNGLSTFIAATNMISYGALVVLAVGVDLGKKKSYLAAAVVLFCQLAGLIFLLIYPEFTDSSAILAPVSKALVAILLGIIVIAKYRDKDHRHTN